MDKNNIIELLGDLKKGKMVIILDDEDRENEGDLVCALSFADMPVVTPVLASIETVKAVLLLVLLLGVMGFN